MSWTLTTAGLYLLGTLVFVSLTSFVNVVDKGKPLTVSRAGLSRFIREWMAHVYGLPLMLAGFGQPRPRHTARVGQVPAPPPHTPVIIVPGYGLNRGIYAVLAAALRRRGWGWVWVVNNTPWSAPIPVHARLLDQRIDQLLHASGASQVDIIGHSMGGVVAAWTINRMDGAGRVRRLVTLGTPWRGTRLHVLGRRRQARDLAPDSEIIRDIQTCAVPVSAVWSPDDEMVSPPAHAWPDGAHAVRIDQLGHLEMAFSARVYRELFALLGSPHAPAPPPLPTPSHDTAP